MVKIKPEEIWMHEDFLYYMMHKHYSDIPIQHHCDVVHDVYETVLTMDKEVCLTYLAKVLRTKVRKWRHHRYTMQQYPLKYAKGLWEVVQQDHDIIGEIQDKLQPSENKLLNLLIQGGNETDALYEFGWSRATYFRRKNDLYKRIQVIKNYKREGR